MGRRPNQLVLEYFNRGHKLPDSSNRYEHTCKRCNQLFPKGRIDSLLSHILKRCPNVTQQDRETVIFHMNSPGSRPAPSNDAKNKENITSHNPFTGVPPQQLQHVSNSEMETQTPRMPPPTCHQQQSALGMLAEVSRRHLDYSTQRGQHTDGHEQVAQDEGRALAEQALLMQLQQASRDMPRPFTTFSARNAGLYSHAADRPQSQQHVDYDIPHGGPVDYHAPPTPAPPSPPRADTASEGHRTPEHVHVRTESDDAPPQQHQHLDPQLDVASAPTAASFGAFLNQTSIDNEFVMWNPTNMTGRQTFGTLSAPSNEPGPGFGLLGKHARKTARSHFSDTRRKEVQDIRKRGACIRCRMLKKPCSEGTPCKTCANVESARLWKGTCIRTRLADEFTLWSTGLFHSKAKIEVPAAVQGLNQIILPGRIEARFFANSDLGMSFAVKQYSESVEVKQKLDPSLQKDDSEAPTIWLLDEGENMSDKIEVYVNRVAHARIADEHSSFLKATLQRAQELIEEEQAQGAEMLDLNIARSCYNLQSTLLKSIVELWVETSILISAEKLELSLRYDVSKGAQQLPDTIDWSSGAEAMPHGSHSYALIKSQLLAATESRCSKLAKIMINELERRLLQRQQVSRFATFMSAVILLNCVERISGFYCAFDHNGKFVTAHGFTSWPLDTLPYRLWTQGEHFADLLIMLLRMRALPPKTKAMHDGTLAAVQDYSLPVHVGGRPVKEQIDEQLKAAAEWLDPIGLRVCELVGKRDGLVLGREDGVEVWDSRFLAKLLLPDGPN